MKRALLWVVDHPLLAGSLVVLVTAVLACQLPRVEIDPSAEGLMVEKDPARDYYERVKRTFGAGTLTIVLVKAEDVFTAPVLRTIRRLSDALERLEGVTRVESLTTARNLLCGPKLR
jgi:uncharacterized protein